MGLSVTVLGSTGSYPGPGDTCSGYLIRIGDTALLVDAGPGVASELQRHTALADLDAVVLSHRHPDHISDFGVLRTALRYGLEREGLPVFCPATVREAVVAAIGHEIEPTIDWRVVQDGATAEVGPCMLTFSRTDHYVETLAVRIDAGDATVLYSADTGPGWSPASLGDGIDLALLEATLVERSNDVLHLTAGEAGALAAAAAVAELALVHLPTGAEAGSYRREAERTFGRAVRIAERGDVFHVAPLERVEPRGEPC